MSPATGDHSNIGWSCWLSEAWIAVPLGARGVAAVMPVT